MTRRDLAMGFGTRRSASLRLLGRSPGLGLVAAGIGGAWLLAILAQMSGTAAALHHHALIEGGPPFWIALPLFLASWQVMVAAMMLPGSIMAIHVMAGSSSAHDAPVARLAALLAGYAVVWTAFGLAAFLGDAGLHHIVDATPWLAARPWLIQSGVLGLTGAYQLSPPKRNALVACRHPARVVAGSGEARDPVSLGQRHGRDCLASSWALMLLMFAAGFANLWWMAGLTMLMAYESLGRNGRRAASVTGAALLALSGLVALTGSVPFGSG